MVRAYLYLAVFIPLTFALAASGIFFTLFDPSGRSYAAHARFWARLSLALAGVRATLENPEKIPDGPIVIMSNHQSNFDILALLAVMPRRICWIAKKELFEIPVFGQSMKRGGYIPLDRGDGRKALKSMEHAAGLVREGRAVVMFPEGTRSRDGNLMEFKRGGFMLAVKAGVPVVPVTINGSGRINPAGKIRLYRGDIRIHVHEPLAVPDGMKRSESESWLTHKVRESISSSLEL